MKDILEKDVLEKVNKLLEKHWREVGCLNEFYFVFSDESCEKVQITGNCVGRRFWRSLLEVVNEFAETFSFVGKLVEESSLSWQIEESSRLWQMYKPFESLKSRSLEELAVKIDLVLREE